MHKNQRTLFAIACLGAFSLGVLSNHAAQTGPFFSVSAGANLVDKWDLGGGSKFDLDVGSRFDGSVGYMFYADRAVSIGAAFETGFLYNSIDSRVSASGARTSVDGDIWQTPFLGKLVFRFMPDSKFVPFIDIGGGGVYSSTEIHHVGGAHVHLEGDETDAGVEGGIGVKYRINDTMSAGLAYKCLIAFPDGFDDVFNHSFLAVFSMTF